MFTHHIITSTLLGSAYLYSFYNVANVVLCIMDIVDYLLPVRSSSQLIYSRSPLYMLICVLCGLQFAKILKYLGYETACTVAFAVFLGVWFVARHVVYMTLWWSIHENLPKCLGYGCYSGTAGDMFMTDGAPDNWSHMFYPFRDINGPICMSSRIMWTFLLFLLGIQVLSLIWFTMIIRIAVTIVRKGAADDTRSDGEDEEEVPDEDGHVGNGAKPPGSHKSSVSESTDTENGRPATVISNGSSQNHHPVRIRTARGRVTLSDHNERKALLGRIGCDKPT